jgi:hypothetical protein
MPFLDRNCPHETELTEGIGQSTSAPEKVNPSATEEKKQFVFILALTHVMVSGINLHMSDCV